MLLDGKCLRFFPVCTNLFKDAPARREDFVTISGSTLMPLKCVAHRWLENVPVFTKER